jgi:hypothetical protein
MQDNKLILPYNGKKKKKKINFTIQASIVSCRSSPYTFFFFFL